MTEWSRGAGGEGEQPESKPDDEHKGCEVAYPQRGWPGYVEDCER